MSMKRVFRLSTLPKLPLSFIVACFAAGGLLFAFAAASPRQAKPTPRYVTKNIEDVQVGDLILAKDPGQSGEATPHRVAALPRNWTEHVVHVQVEGGGEVRATKNHPFFVDGRGWVEASGLRVGDRLRDERDHAVTIERLWTEDKVADTFNLTVEGVHTYFVLAGNTPVLVHNVNVYPDPTPPGYSNGASNLDHIRARSLGGGDVRSNLRPLPSETNFRKGGYEGQLGRDWDSYRRAGLSDAEIEKVLGPEIEPLGKSPPPRPMDPDQLDKLPSRPCGG